MGIFDRGVAHALDGTATALARTFMLSRSKPNPRTLDELELFTRYPIDTLFGGEPGVPEVDLVPRRAPKGLVWSDLSFPSAHWPLSPRSRELSRGDYAANGTVHGRWTRHTDRKARPTLLFLHSWMAPVSRAEDRLLLPRLARALDVDIVSMHLPFHGRRKPKGSKFHGEYYWTADLTRTFEALRQSVGDARALVAWIRKQTGQPVGVMGVSLGGMVTLALACFEPTLAFAIPVAAHLDLAGVLADAGLLKPMRKELAAHGWSPEHVQQYTRSLGLYDLRPCIDRERILFVIGRYDRILRSDRSLALWRRWDEPPLHFFDGGHMGILTHLRGTLRRSRAHIDALRDQAPGTRAADASKDAAAARPAKIVAA